MQELSLGTNFVITIILIYVKPRVLSSIMALVSFSKMMPSSILNVFFDIKELKLHLCFTLRSQTFLCSNKRWKRSGDDQICREMLVLPQGLRNWKPRWEHAFLSTLLSLYLWRTLLVHRSIQNLILLSFWKVGTESWCTWYRKSPACQREFLGFNLRSSD